MFITLEGSEGAGKSTLIERLKKYFLNNNIEFIFTKERIKENCCSRGLEKIYKEGELLENNVKEGSFSFLFWPLWWRQAQFLMLPRRVMGGGTDWKT